MKKIFRIGTRGSLLALAQSTNILRILKKRFPGIAFRLVIIKTTGDEFQGAGLFKKSNTGVFTKALEDKLLNQEIDIAVHSLKDLPTELPKGLELCAFTKRLDPRDVLVSKKCWSIDQLPKNASVGTGSLRRMRQLKLYRPDLKICNLRGNLDTRINRVIREEKFDAVVVAQAGLVRIKKFMKYAHIIPSPILLPAVGQAALGIEVRSNNLGLKKMLRTLNHSNTEILVTAEREFLRTLKGGCRIPVGIDSKIRGNNIHLIASVFSVKRSKAISGQIIRPKAQFKKAGILLGRQLLKKGAAKLLKEARDA